MRSWIGNLSLVCAIAAVAGCSSTSAPGTPGLAAPTPSSAPAAAVSTTPSKPYLTVTPTLELSDRTTKPGTKLKFGQQAVVPFHSYYDKGLLGITGTVDSAPASDEDIDYLPLTDGDKAKLRGKTFFFVRTKMVDLDGTNFTDVLAPTLSATTRSGGWPGALLGGARADVTGCDSASAAPKDFSTPGAVYEQCQLYFGEPSDPITSLAYTDEPYEQAASRAITWRR